MLTLESLLKVSCRACAANGEAAYVEVMSMGEVVSRHGGGGRKRCDEPTRGV